MDDRSNLPLSEQFRLVAKKWVDQDNAASLLEDTLNEDLAERKANLIRENPNLKDNAAEREVRANPEWRKRKIDTVNARTEANRLKLQLEYIRMRHSEQQSFEATQRAERRL